MPTSEFVKNGAERIRVERTIFKGKPYVDARVYAVTDGPEGEESWVPTKKGLCLAPDLAYRVAQAILEEATAEGGDVPREAAA